MSAIATPAVNVVTTWIVDPVHSSAEFKVKHLMISNVKGEFKGITGTLKLDNADLTKSVIDVSIDAATINTRDAQRDQHLKSPDFFDVEKFPTLTFKSNRVAKDKNGVLTVSGNLTIHGVTRLVELEVEGPSRPTKDPWGGTRLGASATTRINRKDFNLSWNTVLEAGGVVIGEDVIITLEIEFIQI
jgi:polyisoprenoid-binding protein YceI